MEYRSKHRRRLFLLRFAGLTTLSILVNKPLWSQHKKDQNFGSESKLLSPKMDRSKLSGIGIFKIGASLDSTLGILARDSSCFWDTTYRVRKEKDFPHLGLNETLKLFTKNGEPRYFIVRITHPKTTMEGFNELYMGVWNPNFKVFIVDKFRIAGIKIKRIYLLYYLDRLVQIRADNTSELARAIFTKYGDPDEKKFDFHQGHIPTVHWTNQDIKTTITNQYITIEIKGSDSLIKYLDKKGFQEESALEKGNPLNKLKEL